MPEVRTKRYEINICNAREIVAHSQCGEDMSGLGRMRSWTLI